LVRQEGTIAVELRCEKLRDPRHAP
jgi:hypothetical protein